MKHSVSRSVMAAVVFLTSTGLFADQRLVSGKVEQAPLVDGSATEAVWRNAEKLVTHDKVADIDISLQSVRTDKEIFFLARFPDKTENREHKVQVWDSEKGMYKIGPLREDTFVIKWNMEPFPVDMSLSSDETYKADIWYWKSHRTDHAGHADDKFHIYSDQKMLKSQSLLSKSGKIFYLLRKGDKGTSAYRNRITVSYEGDSVPGFDFQTPTGSRADVRAKGVWRDGFWTVEFSRKLNTGNTDDVALIPGGNYRFGVSRYEVAGRSPDPDIDIPLFGAGEIGSNLELVLD